MNILFRKFFIMKMEQNIDKAFIITKKINQDKGKKKNKIHNLYEEVIQKNFSTISDLLKKLTVLTSKHQEIQQQFQAIAKRMTKFQTDLQSIHNEHRRDSLHLFSNISEIRTQLAGIDAHIKVLFQDLKLKKSKQKNGGKKLFFVNKSKSLYTLDNDQSDHSSMNNQPLLEQNEINKKTESILKRDSSRRDQLSIQEIKNIRIQQEFLHQEPQSKLNYSEQFRKTNKFLTCTYPVYNQNMMENLSQDRMSQNNLMRNQDLVSNLPLNQTEQIQFYSRQRKRQFRTILQKNEDLEYLNYQIRHHLKNVEENIRNNPVNNLVTQDRKLAISQQKVIPLEIYNQMKIEQKRMNDQFTKAIDEIQAKLQENQRKIIEGRTYCDEKFQKIQLQIIFIQQKCRKFVTEDTMKNETFKFIERHKQNWEDCYYFFAHKQETKNAIQFLQQRLKYIQNSNNAGINKEIKQKVSEVQETKCLCCTRSIPKNIYNKIDLSTMRKTSNSLQATTKRLKPNQLKKRTVEILNKTRKQIPRLTS